MLLLRNAVKTLSRTKSAHQKDDWNRDWVACDPKPELAFWSRVRAVEPGVLALMPFRA